MVLPGVKGEMNLLVALLARTSWIVKLGSLHFADSTDAGVWITPERTLYNCLSSSVSGRTASSSRAVSVWARRKVKAHTKFGQCNALVGIGEGAEKFYPTKNQRKRRDVDITGIHVHHRLRDGSSIHAGVKIRTLV